MSDVTDNDQQIESEAEARKVGTTPVEIWLKKIKLQERKEADWRRDAEEAVKIYEADNEDTMFNIFHSNVETLTSTIYNSTPIPDVRRQFGDKSRVDKLVSDICERFLHASIDGYDYDDEMKSIVKDGEVAGRGAPRLRYSTTMDEAGSIVIQEVYHERVDWTKIVVGPATSWRHVPWLAFPMEVDRETLLKMVEKSSPEVQEWAQGLAPDSSDNKKEAASGILKTFKLYEVWDKANREILFISEKNKEYPITVCEDVLKLKNFFPVPKPYQPIRRLSSTVPVNPFKVYKKLQEELDRNARRINKLINQLKVRGVAAGQLKATLAQLATADDGEYVVAPEDALAVMQNGLDKSISHFPMDPQVKALQELYKQRQLTKDTIYEVTGISDIVRGSSNPNETLGAQKIKTQAGNLRIANRQGEVERISRELCRMKCEILGSQFEEQQIRMMTLLPTEGDEEEIQAWPQALQLIKSGMLGYRVDIETNSTIRSDQTHSQEQMNLFLTGTGNFAGAMGGVAQLKPEILPVIIEIYTAFARKFQLGKQAEDALDKLSSEAPKHAEAAAQQGQEDPEAQARAEAQQQQEMQAQERQRQEEAEKRKHEREKQLRVADIEAKKEVEIARAEAQAQADQVKTASSERIKAAELLINTMLKRLEFAVHLGDEDAAEQANSELDDATASLQQMVNDQDGKLSALSDIVNGLVGGGQTANNTGGAEDGRV